MLLYLASESFFNAMEDLIRKETYNSPYYNLNSKGKITLRGISMPENALDFYEEVLKWINNYKSSPAENTDVNINFSYLNSSSARMIYRIFVELDKLAEIAGSKIICNWCYESDDIGMKDFIEIVVENIKRVEFNLQVVQDSGFVIKN